MLKSAAKVAKKKSAGIDGISAKSIKEYILVNYEMIYQEILTDRYRPNKVLLKRIPKGNGKYRTLAIGTAIDRVILGCIYEYLYPGFDAGMSEYSYGFRKGRNCQQEIQTIISICDQGNKWVIKIDLQNCFDLIDHDKILFMLRRKVEDKGLLRLLNQFMKVSYVNGRNEKKNLVGAPQGNSLSPLYANMILDAVDKMLNKQGHRYVRYADDLFIFCQSQMAAHRTLDMTKNFIKRHCKLRVNEEKTKICTVEHGFNALGFHIYESKGKTHVIPKAESLQEIRQLLKHEIRTSHVNKLPGRINEIIRGWIAYFQIAELGRITRSLDLFIQKQIRIAEKERSINFNKNNIVNCNKLWKEGPPHPIIIRMEQRPLDSNPGQHCSETFFIKYTTIIIQHGIRTCYEKEIHMNDEVLYKSNFSSESGNTGTSVIFRIYGSDNYYEETTFLQGYDNSVKAEIRELSVHEVASIIANHFVDEMIEYPGVCRGESVVNEEIEDLWKDIEEVYICILKASNQEQRLKINENMRDLIFECISWFFQNKYCTKIRKELEAALIREFVYASRRDHCCEDYEPEEWYLRKINSAEEQVTTTNTEQPF